jgi:hypothetical protein
MMKIEIEGKYCHGHSNHELKLNNVILIQITKHVDAFFLRDIHFSELVRIVYMFSCHCIASFGLETDVGQKVD